MSKNKKQLECPYCTKVASYFLPQYNFKNSKFNCISCQKSFKIDSYGNPKKSFNIKINTNTFGLFRKKIGIFISSIFFLIVLWSIYTFLLSPRFTANSFLSDLEKAGVYKAGDYFLFNMMEWEEFKSTSNGLESYSDKDLDEKFKIWKSMVEYNNDYAKVVRFGNIVHKGFTSQKEFREIFENVDFSNYEIIDYEYKGLREIDIFGRINMKYKTSSRLLGHIPYGQVKFNLEIKYGKYGWKVTSFLPNI